MFLDDLSYAGATAIFNAANAALIVGAVIVALGTFFNIQAGRVRERFTDVRISQNETSTTLARVELAKSKAEIAKANAEASTARRETAALTHQNLRLQSELERERAERLKLTGKLASRRVTQEQRTRLTTAIPRRAKSLSIRMSAANDPEAITFANELAAAISAAGIQTRVSSFSDSFPPKQGVIISAVDSVHVASFLTALSNSDIQIDRVQNLSAATATGSDIEIHVGLKPTLL